MINEKLTSALQKAFVELRPFSNYFRNDFERYLFSLETISHIPDIEHRHIIDLGTGIGLMPLALKNMGFQASGLDYHIFSESPDQRFKVSDLKTLESIWEKKEVIIHKFSILNLKEFSKTISADVLICECTIEHLKNPKRFLSDCYNLLPAGGYILITTPNLSTLIKRLRFLFGKTVYWPIEDFFDSGEEFTGHWREYTRKELEFMCERTGFQVVEQHTENVLTKFRNFRKIKKNIRATVNLLASPFREAREIHYVLCKK